MTMLTRYFAVNAPEGVSDIKLDSKGCATCQITVKNVSGAALDGRAVLISLPIASPPAGAVEKNWIEIDGPAERHFEIDQQEVFSIKIAVRQKKGEAAPACNYTFRLDLVNVARPDESSDQSQALRFTVAAAAPATPSRWPVIAAVAAVVLVVGGLATWLMTRANPVPDLSGKTKDEASTILAKAKFNLDQNIYYADGGPMSSGLIVVAQYPQAGKTASAGSLVKISLGVPMAPSTVPVSNPVPTPVPVSNPIPTPPPVESVQCSVFDDGYTNLAGPSDAVTLNNSHQACIPQGACRKWFGRCATSVSQTPVYFTTFNDGYTNVAGKADAVYASGGVQACIPNNTSAGGCRKWFGRGITSDGRTVVCNLFNDGYSNTIGPTDAIFPSSIQLCRPSGAPQGECRKWFGRCSVQ